MEINRSTFRTEILFNHRIIGINLSLDGEADVDISNECCDIYLDEEDLNLINQEIKWLQENYREQNRI